MTKPVRLDAAADREINAAVAWYEARVAGLGIELLAETDSAKRRLVDGPAAFSLVPGVPAALKVRRCPVRRFPYSLVFVELADHIRVLALAHARRRPGYWRKRLPPRRRRGRRS